MDLNPFLLIFNVLHYDNEVSLYSHCTKIHPLGSFHYLWQINIVIITGRFLLGVSHHFRKYRTFGAISYS